MKIKEMEFGLRQNEVTDNNTDAHLIYYVRFINIIAEDLLFCKNINAGGKAQDLFKIVDTFIYENNLDWIKGVGVCADGARSMFDCLQALIQSKTPDGLWGHCINHREALAPKHLSPTLNQVH